LQLPTRSRNAHRLIPRLVHQTYFERINPEKYPNFSRLVNSWKASGWDYSFYTDDDAARFLTEYFPPEVREAYDMLVPGAYKADLFRYCVLFIFGGVYSDVDVMLSADLDVLLEDDIGFMVPVDEVSKRIVQKICIHTSLCIVHKLFVIRAAGKTY
jgi:mannosyltransferase OCH1-like enzyme